MVGWFWLALWGGRLAWLVWDCFVGGQVGLAGSGLLCRLVGWLGWFCLVLLVGKLTWCWLALWVGRLAWLAMVCFVGW